MTDGTPGARAQSNGAAFKADTGTVIGHAAGKALAELLAPQFGQLVQFLPQLVAQGVAQALQQVPVRSKRLCAKCLAARISWQAAHEREMKAAVAAAMAQAGITDENDPRCGQLDVMPFLPDHLRPGSGSPRQMPPLLDAVTTAEGSEVCAMHLPGSPQQPGRRPYLVATAGMNMTQLTGQG